MNTDQVGKKGRRMGDRSVSTAFQQRQYASTATFLKRFRSVLIAAHLLGDRLTKR
ncbi:MAG: hypothetical protein SNJ57_20005 [Cyanobacteriota bacterium]